MVFPDVIPADQRPEHATMAPDRKPEFKVHRNEGLAHSAIAAKKPNQEVAKYHLENGEWVKVWEYVFPSECAFCFGDFDKNAGPRHIKYHLPYRHSGTVMDAPVVCRKCWEADYEKYRRDAQEQRERKQLEELRAKYE